MSDPTDWIKYLESDPKVEPFLSIARAWKQDKEALAEVERDAARYRWLRDQMHAQALTTTYSLPICFKVDHKGSEGDSMDTAIDAAMRADSAGSGQ